MRRLVETNRWQDLFWNELHPYPKILLCFMYDTADAAGFIDYSADLWLANLKGKLDSRYAPFTKKDLVYALEDLKEKLLSNGKKKLFIKDFLFHQGKLPLVSGTEENDWIIAKLKNNLEKFNNAKEIQTILDNVIDVTKMVKDVEDKSTTKKKQRKNFIPPSKEEFVEIYKQTYLEVKPDSGDFAQDTDIEACYDHYKGNGWKAGKVPMQDLEACIRKWIRNADSFKPKSTYSNNNNNIEKKSRTEVSLSVVEKLRKKHYGEPQ